MITPERIQEVGRELIFGTLGVVRTMQTHGFENHAVNMALTRLSSAIAQNIDSFEGALRLHIVDDMMLLNGARLRPAPTHAVQYAAFVELFMARGLGGIAFTQAVSIDALRSFYANLAQPADSEDAARAIRETLLPLADWGIHMLEVRTMTADDVQETLRVSKMAFAMQVYARAMLGFREFVDSVRNGRDPYANRLSIVRVVQDMIDVASTRADYLLDVMRLQKARAHRLESGYNEVHAANTSIFAVLIGRMLKLERTWLLDLGTSALLADVSAALVDTQAQSRNAVLSDEEKARLRDDMTRSMQALLGREGNDDAVMLRTITAYEHRRPLVDDHDAEREPLHLFSRIIAVASAYDAMTTDRPWRSAMSAEEAIENLRLESGKKFDGMVVSTLLTMIQVYLTPPQQAAAGL